MNSHNNEVGEVILKQVLSVELHNPATTRWLFKNVHASLTPDPNAATWKLAVDLTFLKETWHVY